MVHYACQLFRNMLARRTGLVLMSNHVMVAATRGIKMDLSTYGSAFGMDVLNKLSVLSCFGRCDV